MGLLDKMRQKLKGEKFKYPWQAALQSCLALTPEIAERVETFRIVNELPSEQMIYGVCSTPWAIRRTLAVVLGEIRARQPELPEKAAWAMVFKTRLEERLKLGWPPEQALSEDEVYSQITNAEQVVARFKSFDQMTDHLIDIDRRGGTVLDYGPHKDLDLILEGKVKWELSRDAVLSGKRDLRSIPPAKRYVLVPVAGDEKPPAESGQPGSPSRRGREAGGG